VAAGAGILEGLPHLDAAWLHPRAQHVPRGACQHRFQHSHAGVGIGDFCGSIARSRPSRILVERAVGTDPEFRTNVGQALDILRRDHGQLPGSTPGFEVLDEGVELTLAQVPSCRFRGKAQYADFWSNFRTGVKLVSNSARSDVRQVVHNGLYIRVCWQLYLQPRSVAGSDAAVSALRQAQNSVSGAASLGWLKDAGDNLIAGVEGLRKAAAEERLVELNSVYELNPWDGRIVRHTLEFRSPEEDFGLIGALQGVPSMR